MRFEALKEPYQSPTQHMEKCFLHFYKFYRDLVLFFHNNQKITPPYPFLEGDCHLLKRRLLHIFQIKYLLFVLHLKTGARFLY
jgi:hypothetical protein